MGVGKETGGGRGEGGKDMNIRENAIRFAIELGNRQKIK